MINEKAGKVIKQQLNGLYPGAYPALSPNPSRRLMRLFITEQWLGGRARARASDKLTALFVGLRTRECQTTSTVCF